VRWRENNGTGTVKWFNGQNGLVIQPSDGTKGGVRSHQRSRARGLGGLAEGQKVKFELKEDKMQGQGQRGNL